MGEIAEMQEIKKYLKDAGLENDEQSIYDFGNKFVEKGKFNEAIKCFKKLKKICEQKKEYKLTARTCEKIGDCYSQLGREEKRREYYELAGEFNEK